MNFKDDYVKFFNRPFEFERIKRDMKLSHCNNRIFKMNFLNTKRERGIDTRLKSKPKTAKCKYCGLSIDYLDINLHRYACSFYKQYCICGRLKQKIELNLFEEGCNECTFNQENSRGVFMNAIAKTRIEPKTLEHDIINQNQQSQTIAALCASEKIATLNVLLQEEPPSIIADPKFDCEKSKSDSKKKLQSQIDVLRKLISERFNSKALKA